MWFDIDFGPSLIVLKRVGIYIDSYKLTKTNNSIAFNSLSIELKINYIKLCANLSKIPFPSSFSSLICTHQLRALIRFPVARASLFFFYFQLYVYSPYFMSSFLLYVHFPALFIDESQARRRGGQ